MWLGDCLKCNVPDDQKRFTRPLILLVPLSALASRSTSPNAGMYMWVQAVWCNLLSVGYFFLVSARDLVTTWTTESVNIVPNKLWRIWLAKSLVNLMLEGCPSTKWLQFFGYITNFAFSKEEIRQNIVDNSNDKMC